ncbi:4Fe-4S dicluster domain-containing protein [Thermoanaerobacter kivui]|nr:4Fe-4S dicluster domain-containing protein [Thermoanaerobacter kivui]
MKTQLNPFVVANPAKCIGCKACEVACFAVHNRNNHVGATVGTVSIPVIPRLHLIKTEHGTMPIQCRHCEDAPCANVCTVGAIKREGNAIVVDEKLCIGCKSCLLACPFGAIELLPQYEDGREVFQINLKEESESGLVQEPRIIAYKCDLCNDLGEPACVKACPENALTLVMPTEMKKARNKEAALSFLRVVR